MRKYEIIDTDYFDTLPDFYKQTMVDLKDTMDKKELYISDIVGGKRLSLDLVKMIKEGAIFKRFERKIERKTYRKIVTKCFGIKEYYIRMRQDLLRVDLNSVVNLYYSHAIQFFDIQQLVHLPTLVQREIIGRLLTELHINDDRAKRFKFYAKYRRTYNKSRYYANKEKENKFQGYSYNNVVIPLQEGDNRIPQKDVPFGFKEKTALIVTGKVKYDNPGKNIPIITDNDLNPDKLEILTIPVEAVANIDDFPKEKKKGTKKVDLQAKRIKDLNNKISEMSKLVMAPEMISAEKLKEPIFVKKDVPKDELDYYNNHLDMVIPSKPEG